MSAAAQGGPAAIIETFHADAASAATALAVAVAGQLRSALAQRGKASLVVSGGKSPLPFFAALSQQALDWAEVGITLADERWVDPSHPDSNERLLREHLLRGSAQPARLVALKNDAPTPQAGLAATRAALALLHRPFDAVVLGMGTDGHTASLFPGMPGLAAALAVDAPPGVVVGVAPVEPVARLSLNLAALLAARRVFLPIQGAAKRAIYASARRDPDPLRYPVSALFAQDRVSVTVQLIED